MRIPVRDSQGKLVQHTSRQAALKLFSHGSHFKIGSELREGIQAYPQESRHLRKLEVVGKYYIPERLPPVDLPGIKFVEPQSVSWKLQHRTVSFGNGATVINIPDQSSVAP